MFHTPLVVVVSVYEVVSNVVVRIVFTYYFYLLFSFIFLSEMYEMFVL